MLLAVKFLFKSLNDTHEYTANILRRPDKNLLASTVATRRCGVGVLHKYRTSEIAIMIVAAMVGGGITNWLLQEQRVSAADKLMEKIKFDLEVFHRSTMAFTQAEGPEVESSIIRQIRTKKAA